MKRKQNPSLEKEEEEEEESTPPPTSVSTSASVLASVFPVLRQILSAIDKAKARPEFCKSLQDYVNVFITAIESHSDKLQSQTSLPWLPSLEAALAQALDLIQVCASKPFKAKLLASHYTSKIKEAREKIRM